MAHELRDFLASLADDTTLRTYNAMSIEDARAHLKSKGLTTEQQDAVLCRDVSAIGYHLHEDGPVQDFFVASGPTMDPPVRFKVTVEGTMSGGPPTMLARQGTMDPTQGTMDPNDPNNPPKK